MSLRAIARAFLAVAFLTGVLAVVATTPAAAADLTVTVDDNSTDDRDNEGTLRWAIERIAKDNPDDNVIILLTTNVTLDNCGGGSYQGDLDYWRGETITIRNNTGSQFTITQTCSDERVFDFVPGNIVIEGGSGGIVITGGDVTGSSGKGGAISIDGGTASLTDTTLTLNQVQVTGFAQGGALFATGNVTLLRTWFDDNLVSADSGDFGLGGAVKSNGDVTATDSRFTRNTAQSLAADDEEAEGGAIFAVGKVTLTGSSMTGNRAFTQHADAANGGAVYSAATVEVIDSVVAGNKADAIGPGSSASARGGGVFAEGGVTVLRSEFSENVVDSDNGTAAGAAIASEGSVLVTNSTISGNEAAGPIEHGGGIWTKGSATVSLRFATVIENQASDAGMNVYTNSLHGWGSLIAREGGAGSNCSISNSVSNTANWFWADDLSCSLAYAENIQNNGGVLPVVSTKAVNGAANGTENHLPDITSVTSPEIINGAPCDGTTEDQRGVVRPQGSACDIGSVELKGITAVDDTAFTITAAIGRPVTTTVLANDNLGESGPVEVTIYTQPLLGLATANPDNTTTYIPVPLLTTVEEYVYEVCGPVNCDTATVRVTVNGPPAPEFPEQPETPTTPEAGPTSVPRPPAKKLGAPAKAAPAGKTTAPKYTG